MPKKNETTKSEATKIEIDIHVYVHSDRLVPSADNPPEEPSIVRQGKPGGFMDAMSEYARNGKG